MYKGRVLDNRWVVPYSPYLLLKYGSHINVEVCVSVESVKYLYKCAARPMAILCIANTCWCSTITPS